MVATTIDVAGLSALLCSAFHDDPLWRYILGPVKNEEKYRRRMGFVLTCLVASRLQSDDIVVHASEDKHCVAIWNNTGRWKESMRVDFVDKMRFLSEISPLTLHRLLTCLRCMETNHPAQPHMYLNTFGSDGDSQGHNIENSVIEKMIERLDKESIPAYVECTDPHNLPFYQNHGFEICQNPIKDLPKDCPDIISMWRNPRSVA